jgi:RES domain-containing protein
VHGGRFNPRGVPALYLSLDWSTAVIEANQGFSFRIPPLTIISYDVDCENIEDLSTASGLRRNGARREELSCPWKLLAETSKAVPSWVLGERPRSGGLAGIIVPSLAPGAGADARNLVLWRWGDTLPHKVTVFDLEGRLPRNDKSWQSPE